MKEQVIINDVDVSECKKLMNCNNGNMLDKSVKQEYCCSKDAELCEAKPNCPFKEQKA